MLRIKDTDRIIIILTLSLLSVGAVMVYSSSSIMAMKRFGDQYFFVKREVLFVAIGLLSFIIAANIPYQLYRKFVYPLLLLTVLLLCLVFIDGLGVKTHAASRWIKLGFINFQPSELAKLSLVIFISYSLEAKERHIKTFSLGVLPNIVIPAIPLILILKEPDFGSVMMVSIVILIMLFLGGVRWSHIIALFSSSLPVVYLLIGTADYRLKRLLIFINPWNDPQGKGFQMVQSFLAIGSGGLYGVGLGEGRQKLFFLPEAHTDFILSIIGEELGLFGIMIIVFLYAVFFIAGIRVAMRAEDKFGTYLAVGITLLIGLQAIMNMGVVMGLLPPKGLPLPLISYGGSSLVITMVMAGILLNICRRGYTV